MCLQHGLFNEAPLPSMEGGPTHIEDCIVSLLLDKPGAKHEDLHEEFWVEVVFGLHHHHMEGKDEVPINTKMVPALGTERTFEEQVKSSFLYIHSANGTVVVIVMNLVFFLHKILRMFSMSMRISQIKTFILLKHLESQIHINRGGGSTFL
jgi:hypothetical protein